MSETLRNLVIGTSLTGPSDSIVQAGLTIARAADASPWLIHGYVPAALPPDTDVRWLEQQAEALRSGLEAQAERTGLAGLSGFRPSQLHLGLGSPVREILDLARQVHADLIVLGATEGGSLHRIFLGSTADGVLRKATCPVLVVRPESTFPPRRVEIPVDLSPLSACALRQGLRFLDLVGSPLDETEALFVLDPFEAAGSIHFASAQIERFAREELQRFLQTNSPGEPPRLARVLTGFPDKAILSALSERHADLVILGTHGRGGFERLTLGSVAAEVMHKAGCSLLIVPPDATLRARQAAGEDWDVVSDVTPVVAGRA